MGSAMATQSAKAKQIPLSIKSQGVLKVRGSPPKVIQALVQPVKVHPIHMPESRLSAMPHIPVIMASPSRRRAS